MPENQTTSQQTHHMDWRWWFVSGLLDQGLIKIDFVKTKDSVSDIGMKNVNRETFQERTIKSSTDNIVSLHWERKGAVSADSPATQLLWMQALHQWHHQYLPLKDYLEGKRNVMVDDASRLTHYSNEQLLTHFNTSYPQDQSWQLWAPPQQMISPIISALHKQWSKPEWYLQEPPQ
jgi:hypothetical protein